MAIKNKVGLDDYLVAHTVAELKALPRERIQIKPNLQVLIEELDPESDTSQIEHMLKLVAKLSNGLDIDRTIEQVHQRTRFRLTRLRAMVEGFRATANKSRAEEPPVDIPEAEKQEALELLRSPTLLQQFLADVEQLGCVGQNNEKTLMKLATTSGQLSDNPVNVTIKGESATGKNFLMNTITDTEPPEDVFSITRMSAKALQYLPTSLRHKIVAISEVPGAEDADYSIRTFQSEKVIKIWSVEKNAEGHLETAKNVVEGPAVFFQTTTKTHLHLENETREFDLYVDESAAQTERIFMAQRKAYIDPMSTVNREHLLRRWQNAARMLASFPVLIPFADRIRFPLRPLRVRRDHDRLLALIASSALLHQHQREIVEKNGLRFLVAAIDDYAIARELVINLLKTTLSGATPKCRALVKWAEEQTAQNEKFSKKEIDDVMGWDRKTTLKYLNEAVGLGCIDMDMEKVAKSKEFWFVKEPESPLVELTKPEDLVEDMAK